MVIATIVPHHVNCVLGVCTAVNVYQICMDSIVMVTVLRIVNTKHVLMDNVLMDVQTVCILDMASYADIAKLYAPHA